jgi:alkylation response protein AidB-like acyl-CoA dehydrogenase
MDLSLSQSEEMLRASVRTFVQREAGTERLVELQGTAVGCLPGWTEVMAASGWLGLLVPDDCGGAGATALEAAVVAEEFGRGAVPGPFLCSSIVGTLLLRACGPTRERQRLLAGIAAGEVILAPALLDPQHDWDGLRDIGLRLEPVPGAGYVLDGSKVFVPFVDAATHLLVAARLPGKAGTALAAVPVTAPGVRWRRLDGFLAWNYEVRLSKVAVVPESVLAPANSPDAIDSACDWANAIIAAYQVGGSQSLLERSVDYSNTRFQFGQPIGRFQRVQDHIIGLLNSLDAARWATYEALWQIDSGGSARASAHMAKAVASESYLHCANAAHEVHAGIGSDPAYGLTLYTQLSRSLYHYLGSPRWHKRKMVDALQWSQS